MLTKVKMLADFVPEELRNIENPQTALAQIAKNAALLSKIEEAGSRSARPTPVSPGDCPPQEHACWRMFPKDGNGVYTSS